MQGLKIGHVTHHDKGTGVSVFLFEPHAVGSYVICGSGPASHELAPLDPEMSVPSIHALMFAGGSAFGLHAAAGVMQYLVEQGVGLKLPHGVVPIVPAASVYDLVYKSAHFPDAKDGYNACLNARADDDTSGQVGAGTGATVGKLIPDAKRMTSGIGRAVLSTPDGLEVIAYAVVNAVGDIYDQQGTVAGARLADGTFANCEKFLLSGEQIGNRQYLSFGFHPDADIKAEVLQIAETQRLRLKTPQGEIEINLPLLGQHNILNTLAASAATLALRIDLTAIKAGIESIQAAPGRLQLHKLANGVNVIDDTYNANPFSLKAALDTLARFHGKKILVLGDMKELGDEEVNLHHIAGGEIRKAGIDYLFTYGQLSETTAIAFGEGAYHFNEQEKLVTALRPFLYNHTTILIKGSRSMRMERVVQGLMS